MARIAVTGATGFIGTRLVDRLRRDGHEVTILLHTREAPGDSVGGLTHCRVDVTDAESLRGKFDRCDLVYHLAGCTIARSRNDFFRVNRDGTKNVALACASASQPPRLLYVSSLAAAGPASNGRPLSETDPPHPVSNYGLSKLAAEQTLGALADALPIQIVRPPSVFGDCDPYMLGLFKTAKAGWVFLPGRTPHRYSLIHVDDLVDAMVHVAQQSEVCLRPIPPGESGNPGPGNPGPGNPGPGNPGPGNPGPGKPGPGNPGLVHLAQDPALSFEQTARLVAEAFGRVAVRRVGVPASLCWTLAGANSLAARLFRYRPLINLDKVREGMSGSWLADSRRLTETMGFRFPHSLEERIDQTAKSYHRKGWI